LIMKMELVWMEKSVHVAEDQLERYSIGTLHGTAVAQVEEHVLICETCQNKLASIDSWVRSVRRAGAQLRSQRDNQWQLSRVPRFVPALAAAIILVFAAGAVLQLSKRGAVTPLAVALEATRGENVARVPARQPLLIQPGLDGLPQLPEYRLEIVDRLGKRVSQNTFTPANGHPSGTSIPGLASGVYFARLYSPSGDLLREYALEVRGPRQ
jgi:hypothetical protein